MKKYCYINLFVLIWGIGLGFTQSAWAEGDIEKGKTKAIACQVCHGKGGKSTNPLYPVLAGQHTQYIVKQLRAFNSGTRKDPIMNGMAAPLTEEDMHDLAAYFNSNGAGQ